MTVRQEILLFRSESVRGMEEVPTQRRDGSAVSGGILQQKVKTFWIFSSSNITLIVVCWNDSVLSGATFCLHPEPPPPRCPLPLPRRLPVLRKPSTFSTDFLNYPPTLRQSPLFILFCLWFIMAPAGVNFIVSWIALRISVAHYAERSSSFLLFKRFFRKS